MVYALFILHSLVIFFLSFTLEKTTTPGYMVHKPHLAMVQPIFILSHTIVIIVRIESVLDFST